MWLKEGAADGGAEVMAGMAEVRAFGVVGMRVLPESRY